MAETLGGGITLMVLGAATTTWARAYLSDFRGIASKIDAWVRPTRHLDRPLSRPRPILDMLIWARPAARLYRVLGPITFVGGLVILIVAIAWRRSES